MSEENDHLQELLEVTREHLEWYKAVNFSAVGGILRDALESRVEQVVYELTTPDRSGAAITSRVSELGLDAVSSRTVNRWQQQWVRMGLVRQVSARQRERIFDLRDFGFNLDVLEGESV